MTLKFNEKLSISPSSSGETTINNQDINVTINGEYRAETGYTGLGTVTVNVPGSDTITATNTSSDAISLGDKVWINSSNNSYSLVPYYVYGYNNFTVEGSPTINQSTGVVNNFGSDSWLTLPEVFNPGSNTWEVMFKVVTGTVENESHWVIGTGIWGTDFQGFTLGYEPFSKLCFYLSESGESWDIAGYTEGETTLLDNTLYYFKLQFTGTEYILSLSTDGTNWNTEATVESSTPIYVSQSPLAIGSNLWNNEANTTYWDGSIDLSESYIKINNQVWWTGYGQSVNPAITNTTLTGKALENIAANASGSVKTIL